MIQPCNRLQHWHLAAYFWPFSGRCRPCWINANTETQTSQPYSSFGFCKLQTFWLTSIKLYQEIESLQAIASWSLQTGQARQLASTNESLPGAMVAPASPSPCEFQRGDCAPLNYGQPHPKYCKIKRASLGFKTKTVHTITAMQLCCCIVFWCFLMIMHVLRFWSTFLVQSTMTSEQTGLHDWQQIKGVFLSLAKEMQRTATKSPTI